MSEYNFSYYSDDESDSITGLFECSEDGSSAKFNNYPDIENVIKEKCDLSELTLENLVELRIEYCNLSSTTEDIWLKLSSLQSLFLLNNNLSDLPSTFGALTTLQNLTINDNLFTKIPDSIYKLSNLETLNLKDNYINTIDSSIKYLSKLENLILDNNKIHSIPDGLGELCQLKIFSARFNEISTLPDNLGELESLKELKLQSNRLSSLPESFSQLSQLTTLELSDNDLSDLPDCLESHKTLVNIYLEKNKLMYLPKWFYDLPSLKNCLLKSNNLVKLDEFLAPNLQTLYLGDNQLTSLPDSICKCRKFVYIDFNGDDFDTQSNMLYELPSSFGEEFSNLVKLKLYSCGIEKLPEKFGEGLTSLNELNLAKNSISMLPETFCKMNNLVRCNLENNQIEILPKNFGDLTNLTDLSLSNNKISYLPPSFNNLENLISLDLYDNKLTSFPSFLRFLPKIEYLGIDIKISTMILDLSSLGESLYKLIKIVEAGDYKWSKLKMEPDVKLEEFCNYLEKKDGKRLLNYTRNKEKSIKNDVWDYIEKFKDDNDNNSLTENNSCVMWND